MRADEQAFVIDGPTLVGDAISSGLRLEGVYAEPDAADGVVGAARAAGVAVHDVEPGVLARVTDTVTPQGLVAVAALPHHALADIAAGVPLLVLVGIADPGNAGTLCRSAEAAGFGAVLFTAGSVDPFAPKCVRASAGSVFRIPVISGAEAGDVLDEIGATGRSRIATVVDGAPAYTDAELPLDGAIVLGNEAHGLSAAVRDHVDATVTIPLSGRIESLNVAMAGTVLCFEVARRRRQGSER